MPEKNRKYRTLRGRAAGRLSFRLFIARKGEKNGNARDALERRARVARRRKKDHRSRRQKKIVGESRGKVAAECDERKKSSAAAAGEIPPREGAAGYVSAAKGYTVYTMPTAITHQLLAEEVFAASDASLRKRVASLPLYYFGAQGPDFWFAHGAFSLTDNLGRHLHTRRPLLFFRILAAAGRTDADVFSYAAGYLTHYAADTVFHPYVYGMMRKLGRESKYLHHAIEHALDGALLRALRGVSLLRARLPKAGDVNVEKLGKIYETYVRYARATGRDVPARADYFRALRRYDALNAVRTPFYTKEYALPAEKLFTLAKRESLRLLPRLAAGTPLKACDFGRNFLSGEIV